MTINHGLIYTLAETPNSEMNNNEVNESFVDRTAKTRTLDLSRPFTPLNVFVYGAVVISNSVWILWWLADMNYINRTTKTTLGDDVTSGKAITESTLVRAVNAT